MQENKPPTDLCESDCNSEVETRAELPAPKREISPSLDRPQFLGLSLGALRGLERNGLQELKKRPRNNVLVLESVKNTACVRGLCRPTSVICSHSESEKLSLLSLNGRVSHALVARGNEQKRTAQNGRFGRPTALVY